MGVESHYELSRTLESELRGTQVAVRRFAVVLGDNTLEGSPTNELEIISGLGLDDFGAEHPDLTGWKLRKIGVTERYGDSPYHVEVTAEYGGLDENDLLAPISRAASWSFEPQQMQVPALWYYEGTGNSNVKALTNSAYDYFEGLMTDERVVQATMKKNFAAFPTSQMAATNSLNNAEYFGGAQYTWKCAGVSATWVTELFNRVKYTYWETTCVLIYRQTGWALKLPDVGWNYIAGGQKRRAMVFDFENSEWVASANPVALSGGAIQLNGYPAILDRRVNPEANFSNLFGTPPS